VDAVLAPGLVICDGASVGIKLLGFNDRLLKVCTAKWQIKFSCVGLDANAPALRSLIQDHPAGVIPQ